MTKIYLRYALIAALFFSIQGVTQAQEFPIAVGSDTTFSGGAVYGGQNGLAAVYGDALSPQSITAQLVGPSGTLIGQRISLGATGVMPGAMPLFDGTNYFLVWLEFNGTVKGQFITTLGSLVGESFTIATNVSTERNMNVSLALSDSLYLVIFIKTDYHLYGQLVSKTGILTGNQFQISGNLARDFSIAYDGENFLIAWVEIIAESDKDIFGQFVGNNGTLVGTNFLIDGGPNLSDNPTSLAFDGTRYLLGFHEAPSLNTKSTLCGRFITVTGEIQETITICDSTNAPSFPSVAFDSHNYFITWMQRSNGTLMGRFFNTSGIPVDAPSEIFGPQGNKVPFGGVGFGGNLYLVVATRTDSNFSDGDVYGRFIQPLTGVQDGQHVVPEKYLLLQNYPNPFNPSTVISYQLPVNSDVTLKVYDALGREVATLVNEVKEAGSYSVSFPASSGDASRLTSGIYFAKLSSGNNVLVRKMMLIK